MSKPKETKKYPAVYLDYATALSKNPELRIPITFPDLKAAHAFLQDFYAFKSAAINEGLDEMFPEIAAFNVGIERVPDSPERRVVISHNNYSERSKMMRAALEEALRNQSQDGKSSQQEGTTLDS